MVDYDTTYEYIIHNLWKNPDTFIYLNVSL